MKPVDATARALAKRFGPSSRITAWSFAKMIQEQHPGCAFEDAAEATRRVAKWLFADAD